MKRKIAFKEMTLNDLPLYYTWAEKEHVKNTWFLDGYEPVESIKQIIEGNGYDYGFLIIIDDVPIGYLQYCDLFAYKNLCLNPKGTFKDEPAGTVCMDLFIGEEAYLGKGYGTQIVQKFCDLLFSQPTTNRILIDPSIDNKRAVRCYEKAGFKKIREKFDGVTMIVYMEKLRRDGILSRIIDWGQQEDAIVAMMLTGSRAQKGESDDLSDYDIALFATTYDHYLDSDAWMANISPVWVYIVPEPISFSGQDVPTRLVIFEKGIKVDFAFYSLDILKQLSQLDSLPDEFDIGYEVLFDKKAITDDMAKPSYQAFQEKVPSEEEFLRCIREFWFEAYHVVKYLQRGDLWSVKFRDNWIKQHSLLQMIRWNSSAKHDWKYTTHSIGKRMEIWVDKNTWDELYRCFGHFDQEDSQKAFVKTIELFRRLSTESANMLGYHYPEGIDKNIFVFITDLIR